MVHVDQAAVLLDVFELGRADAWMLARVVDGLQPDHREDDAQRPHHHEHVLPAEAEHDPTHDRCEQGGGEVLRGVEDGRGGTAFLGREPGRDDTGITWERRGFGKADEEAQGEQGHDCPGNRKAADKALQQGEQRPGEDAEGVDVLGTEAVEQPATRNLASHVSPSEGGEDITEGYGVNAEVFLQAGACDCNGRAVGIVDRGHQEQHEQDQVAHMRLFSRLHAGCTPTSYFCAGSRMVTGAGQAHSGRGIWQAASSAYCGPILSISAASISYSSAVRSVSGVRTGPAS